ncbi:hypothetical protein LWM68_33885 [Niabella sp. W65]|nr:hypothetical protein [Niabella sp. W65]MCH7367316.1 hypothetical protein [Niabella sp. W65]
MTDALTTPGWYFTILSALPAQDAQVMPRTGKAPLAVVMLYPRSFTAFTASGIASWSFTVMAALRLFSSTLWVVIP